MLQLSIGPFPNKFKPDAKRAGFISNNIAKHVGSYSYDEIEQAILTGCAWSSIFTNNRRCQDTWYGQQLFAADVDNGKIQSIEQAIAICEQHCIEPYIIHESFSSKPGKLKMRIMFKTTTIIQDYGTALGIQRKLAEIFDGDLAVCDVARLFYGTNKPLALTNNTAWLDIDELGKLDFIEPPAKATPILLECDKKNAVQLQNAIMRGLAKNNSGRFDLICTVIKEQQTNVKTVAKGSGYESVFKAAISLGRFKELLAETITISICKWIDESPEYANWRHLPNKEQIISAGIVYGRKQLYD